MSFRRAPVLVALVSIALAMACAAVPTESAFKGSTANPAGNFTAAASFGCTPPALTPIWMDGMENAVPTGGTGSGLFDDAWAGSPAPAITADTAVKRNGNYALKFAKTSATQTGGLGHVAGGTLLVWRWAFRFNALPSGDIQEWANTYDAAVSSPMLIGWSSSSQKLIVSFQGGTQRLSSMTISAGTWYLMDMRVNMGANPRTVNWQINGVAQTQATKAVAGGTIAGAGWGPANTDGNVTFWVNDVVMSQTSTDYPIGDGKVLGVSPDAMGTSSDPSTRLATEAGAWGSTTWNKLDEVPMTSSTDYVKQTAVDATAYLETTFADTAESCINGVQGELAYMASSATANSAKTSVFDGGTERVVFSGNMATTTLSYKSAIVAPASGTWTQSSLNALKARIGFASSVGSQPQWHALMLEYNVDL